MRNLLLTFVVFGTLVINAQVVPIFDPSMSITEYLIVDSPAGEEVDKIIDGSTNTKFLDFELDDGMGFTVDLGGTSSNAIFMEMTTANDFPERDPIDFEILGSNDGSTFTSIATGPIDCITDRFETRIYEFTNANSYLYYRVNFSSACDPTGGAGVPSIQVAELQLYEPELGVTTNSIFNQVSIYPNPANGAFSLAFVGKEKLIRGTILNLSGKIIRRLSVNELSNSKEIRIPDLASGLYLLKIETNNSSATKKLLVQ